MWFNEPGSMGRRERSGVGEEQRFFQTLLRAGFLIILALAIMHPAWGEDVYTQMLRRYDEMNAELEHAINEIERGVETQPYVKRVLSMNRNATVTIGGELRTAYAFSEGGGADPLFTPSPAPQKYDSKTGALNLSTARISVDARAGGRWRAYLDINLNGRSGTHTVGDEEPYHINQAYIELMKGGHSGFGAIVGMVKLPFGLWRRPNLYVKSFLDAPDLNESYLMHPTNWRDEISLPHASRFQDPSLTAMAYYEMRDIIRFDAAVFQEGREGRDVTFTRNGVTKLRTEEPPPLSWQAGASLQPLDGWELTAHFRNRHSRARDETPSFGAVKNEQALVVGLAAEIPNTKLSVSAEYALGWNQGFNEHIESESLNLAFAYKLTPKLTLHAQGEWLHVTDGSRIADTRDNRLCRAMFGAEYELMRHMTLEAGWQYEYWNAKSYALNDSRVNTVNTLYVGTRFLF